MKKQYSEGQVIYGFVPAYRKWSFQWAGNALITPCLKGLKSAQKIAQQINKSVSRCGKVDNIAHANINKLAWS